MAKKNQVKNKIYIGNRFVDILLVLFFVIMSIIFIYPFLNVIAISLSSNSKITTGQVSWFPKEFNVKGYEILFQEAGIWRSYLNTIIICIGFMICNLSMTSLMAYVMMVPDFVLKKFLSIMLLITMFFSGGIVPGYLLIRDLDLMNSWWSLILPGCLSAYNVFVYRAFYNGISHELREAARIDGAGEFQILLRIYVPLSKALYASFGLFAIVGQWNSYYSALLYINDEAKYPIQMVLRKIIFTAGTSDMVTATEMLSNGDLNPLNVQYACVVATALPVMVIYPFLQKYFAQGVQVGAVKG
ncbi:MAG: carbohydrate ABC transporter permease [Lachnospiraceae bacterium]|nr:carbohydrate ABC transporter permease [Lachnospiraceae bacterium]